MFPQELPNAIVLFFLTVTSGTDSPGAPCAEPSTVFVSACLNGLERKRFLILFRSFTCAMSMSCAAAMLTTFVPRTGSASNAVSRTLMAFVRSP